MAAFSWGDPDQWRAAMRGDRDAFAALVTAILPRVRGYVFRAHRRAGEVDDLTQEVFLRLVRSLDRLRDPERAGSFVLGIAANVVREVRRDEHPQELPEIEAGPRDPSDRAWERELQGRSERAMLALPHTLRETLVLSVYERLSPSEIAEVLGLPDSAVRHRLFRARTLMRQALEPVLSSPQTKNMEE